jgi:hypothetical protein
MQTSVQFRSTIWPLKILGGETLANKLHHEQWNGYSDGGKFILTSASYFKYLNKFVQDYNFLGFSETQAHMPLPAA